MARIPLVCPIDGTNLGAANANITPTVTGQASTDPHVHLIITFQLTCANGHVWGVTNHDLPLMRVS